jgi:ribosomal protein S3
VSDQAILLNPHRLPHDNVYKYSYLQAVADGVFKAELNELLTRELAEDGYSGVEVRRTTTRTELLSVQHDL